MKLIQNILLYSVLIFLTSCLNFSVVEWAAPPGQVLFQDDFSDSSSGWSRQAGQFGAADYYQNSYRIWVNKPDYDLWTNPGLILQDVRVEVDAVSIGSVSSNRFGLICRYQDSQNFYFFIISSDGYYAIGKNHNGVYTLLGQEMMAYNENIQNGIEKNRLRADCVDDILMFYVNDFPVAVISDLDFRLGDVGLIAGSFADPGTDVLFDNFIVLKP